MKSNKSSQIREINETTINNMYENYTPIFVLSTGRSGSKFIAKLFDLHNKINAYHEPDPSLEIFCNYVFQNEEKIDEIRTMFKTARLEIILKSYRKKLKYFESNQCMVFFVEAINHFFPNAKFIHLIRDPYSFVKSAWQINFYNKKYSLWEHGRIKATNDWRSYNQVEKLYWYYNTVNQKIEKFKSEIGGNKVFTLKSRDLFDDENEIVDLFDFINEEPLKESKINKIQNKPVNTKNTKKRQVNKNILNEIKEKKNYLVDEKIVSKYNFS